MPLFEKKLFHDALIGVWKIEEDEDTLLSLLPDPSAYEEQLAVLLHERRRLEYLAVRVLLFRLTGRQQCVGYETSGKPYLTGHEFHISISHTHGWASVILHPSLPVAIDIEQMGDRASALSARFLNETEISNSDPRHPTVYHVLCWSAKETLFKRIDCAGVDFKTQLHLSPFKVSSEGVIDAAEECSGKWGTFKIYYETHPHWVLTYLVG